MSICIRIEDGVIQEVTSDDQVVQGANVAIVQNDTAERLVRVMPENLTAIMLAANARTQCEGIGIACEVAGERILDISKTRYDDPVRMIDDVNGIMEELVRIVAKAIALRE